MTDTARTAGVRTIDKEELREQVATVLDIDPAEIADDAHFADDLEVDSLLALEITVRLEREYGVRLDEAELPSVTSLQATYELLSRKLREQG
ncbi:acyl carrier protein [Actinoplanes sp. NPDC049316]|uniref:acyl carrier protein n=1 Tax=Actinoplanes sp. NPDC049316 TaxID=3154727 RepID=UPI0034336BB3